MKISQLVISMDNRRSSEIQGTALGKCLQAGTCIYRSMPAGVAHGGGDSSVVSAPDSRLKGRGFESLLERRENFLL